MIFPYREALINVNPLMNVILLHFSVQNLMNFLFCNNSYVEKFNNLRVTSKNY